MTSLKIFKRRDFLWDKNTIKWKTKSMWLGLVRKQDVAKAGRIKPKINVFKICVKLWRHGEETNVSGQTGTVRS